MPEVIAILCSDIHLSHRPPIARSAEPDWYAAMARPLKELKDLSKTDDGCVPIICAGDVFDKWNSSPELINFALEHLPEMYAIPGQHDLPYHGMEEIKKSAFWTLMEANKIRSLRSVVVANGVFALGFPWGADLRSPKRENDDMLWMAVAHQYVWTTDDHYVGADPSGQVLSVRKKLQGYDVALFGDNHKGFLLKEKGKPTIFNAGTLMRRTSAERDYRPMVGLLHEDGTVKKHHLDTSQDKFLDDRALSEAAEESLMHLEGFLDGLKGLGESGLDFERAIETALAGCDASNSVRRVILEAMEKEKQ